VKSILDPANRGVLEDLAHANAVLAFDYDGTLAPIVADPAAARMRPATRDRLEALCRAYPCIVISGRAQDDVSHRLRGLALLGIIGNHGLEPWRRTDAFAARVRSWLPGLASRLCSLEGVVIEDKVFSLAIHYRLAPQRRVARDLVVEAAAGLEGVRIVFGKEVVCLLPADAPHKGLALQKYRHDLGCDVALYVGDDETDEDVFALDDPCVVSVRVGMSARTRARFCVRDQRQVDSLLARLLDLRSGAACRAIG
jgi:trehalose 6-phosphate phosphatase